MMIGFCPLLGGGLRCGWVQPQLMRDGGVKDESAVAVFQWKEAEVEEPTFEERVGELKCQRRWPSLRSRKEG
jgi:hypothetical protein